MQPLERAKRPRSIIAGPYGHPLHATVVTLPIGAWVSSLVFDIVALLVDDPAPFAVGALVLVWIGIAGALLAVVFGLLDLSVLTRGTAARRTALTHMAINFGAIVVFLISALVRMPEPEEASVAGFVLSIVGVLAIGVSGYLGGKLAYHYGVRVALEETQAEGFRTNERTTGRG